MAFDVKKALEFIQSKEDYLKTAEALYEIYNRNITKYLNKRIDDDVEGEDTRREAKSRLCTVNVLPKIVSKLSGVYQVTPQRNYVGYQDFDALFAKLKFQESMQKANNFLNLFRVVAVEAVAESDTEGKAKKSTVEKIRVYPAHKFLLMDDGTIDNNVIAFIKILGNQKKGNTQVMLFEAYTKEEYVTFDSDGRIQSQEFHDFGRIPVSWATRDIETVMPATDKETMHMVTLLPLLMSDMNYGLKYKCFSITYFIGLTPTSGGIRPNGAWCLKPDVSSESGDRQEVGQLSPTIAVSEMLEAIHAQYSMWLDSRNIKISSLDGGSSGNLSGIAKAIDSADVSEDVLKQRELFKSVESDTLFLVGRLLGSDIKGETVFPETTILPETPKEKIDRIVTAKNESLLSWEEAVKQANPGMTEEQLQVMMLQIKSDKQRELAEKEQLNGMGRNGNSNQDQGKQEAE
jgi:hypothetical protein